MDKETLSKANDLIKEIKSNKTKLKFWNEFDLEAALETYSGGYQIAIPIGGLTPNRLIELKHECTSVLTTAIQFAEEEFDKL